LARVNLKKTDDQQIFRTVLVHVCLKIATTKFKTLNNMALKKHLGTNGYENSSI